MSFYTLLFFLILCFGFVVANNNYQFYNFHYNEGIILRFFVMLPLIALVFFVYKKVLPSHINDIPNLYWYFFIFLTIVPSTVIYIFNGIGESKNIFVFIYLVSLLGTFGALVNKRYSINLKCINVKKGIFWSCLVTLITVSYVYIVYKLGLPKNIISSFTDVYTVRLNYRNSSNRVVDYLVQWIGNAINPFIFAYTLREKKIKKSLLVVLLELLLYTYTAYKSLLFVLFMAPIFAFIISEGVKKSVITFAFNSSILIGTIAGFSKLLMIYLLTVLRIFLWPALIAFEYYDFFYMYPKANLAYSSFMPFVQDKYKLEPPFLLAKLYYNRPQMRANTTWYADAYANFGYIGVVVFAIILILLLVIISNIQKKDRYLVCSCLFGGIITLFNGPLLTTLLTGGLAVGIILAYLIPKEICSDDKAHELIENNRILNLVRFLK